MDDCVVEEPPLVMDEGRSEHLSERYRQEVKHAAKLEAYARRQYELTPSDEAARHGWEEELDRLHAACLAFSSNHQLPEPTTPTSD